MANIQINITENGTTTLLTNGCICDRDIDVNVDIPATGGAERSDFVPDKALTLISDCSNQFYAGSWDWFVEQYGDEITTNSLTNTTSMFQGSFLEKIPFEFNYDNAYYRGVDAMFRYCRNLKEIGKIKNFYPEKFNYFFNGCHNLRHLPEFENADFSRINTYAYASLGNNFQDCYSLREIPEDFLKKIYNPLATSYSVFDAQFSCCYVLDEIRGLNPQTGTMTNNKFAGYGTFSSCNRVKDIIFCLQEDGTPYTANWKGQVINLSDGIGWANKDTNVTGYNSGITDETRVRDDASYQALKDNPDWWTTDYNYSRYNHDSAVNTINTLPDTSAYLATQSGATNIIRFKGAAGSKTDGGAINTLTEEEIAVATAKGWTVEIV